MDVEDVARIGLAPRRLAQQQRELAVGRRVLGQIVDDHQHVPPWSRKYSAMVMPAKGASHCRPGRRSAAGDDEDAALEGAVLAHRLDHLL